MFRRKTRNSAAFAGAELASPTAQALDNTAMAAALTIGQNLRQTCPKIYGKPKNTLQQPWPNPGKPSLSLLNRSALINSGMGMTSAPRGSRAGLNGSNRHSVAPQSLKQAYNVDNSFNDSLIEEMGNTADAHYSNETQLRDLTLHHKPQAPPAMKMVKKYIPTPNGITVVEVPEESIKKDIARSNSMRSGLSYNRSGLTSHSMTNAARANKLNRLHISSLASAPRIDEQIELDYQRAQNSADLDELHRQIEHEKKVARGLERQRAEYEQLRNLRAENARKLKELQVLQEEETVSFHDGSSMDERVHVSNDTAATSTAPYENHLKAANSHARKQKPSRSYRSDSSYYDEEEEDFPIALVPFVVDELDLKQVHAGNHDADHSGSEKEFPSITTSPHDVLINSYGDTFLLLSELEGSLHPSRNKENASVREGTDAFGIEEVPIETCESPNLVSQLRSSFATQLDSRPLDCVAPPVNNIQDGPETFTEPKERQKSSTPLFDPVPEVIGSYEDGSLQLAAVSDSLNERAVAPPALAGSIRSVSSVDSKSRPIKSAMKSSKSSYTQSISLVEKPAQNLAHSPAHQAYLSLTTAENTRLNSKLSVPQLNDTNLGAEAKLEGATKLPNAQRKRMSQSLRKLPSTSSQGGLSGRSLRPQSMAEFQPIREPGGSGSSQVSGGGMSSGNLKNPVQPIAPHPTSKPNYQSPSKIRATELYAKANRRPISEFQPVPRRSSFSRELVLHEKAGAEVPARSAHRTTLRSHPVASLPPNAAANGHRNTHSRSSLQQYSTTGFQSKFADSDADQSAGTRANGGFLSRFADSEIEASSPQKPGTLGMKSLRKKEESGPEPEHEAEAGGELGTGRKGPAKEKKPKKKFLRKLFGRN